jgi:hypothetical protein
MDNGRFLAVQRAQVLFTAAWYLSIAAPDQQTRLKPPLSMENTCSTTVHVACFCRCSDDQANGSADLVLRSAPCVHRPGVRPLRGKASRRNMQMCTALRNLRWPFVVSYLAPLQSCPIDLNKFSNRLSAAPKLWNTLASIDVEISDAMDAMDGCFSLRTF